ncbi:cytochrome P450 2B9-like [Saccostrea cucullata]|uniref:cytochrome P450 2B9-like n=1 Tax=Saccostrea cuccullata TaxID=36930 RepID=UPI002ED1C193
MSILSLPVILLTTALFVGFLAMFWSRDDGNLPPREPGRLLVGNVDIKTDAAMLFDLQKKHGDLITLKVFGQTIIVVCGYNTIKEVLVKHGESTSAHTTSFGFSEYFELSGIFGASGTKWRNQRKFGHETFRSIDSGSNNLESRVLEELPDVFQEIDKMKGTPFDVSRLIKTSHYNIISSLLFGQRFAHDDATLTRLVDLLDEVNKIVPEQLALNFMEWLKYVPGDPFKVRRRRFLVDEIFKIVEKSVDEHKETLENPKSDDFIHSFLQEQGKRKLNKESLEGFADRDILILGYTLYFTSAPVVDVLYWFILYLMHNQDVVVRMRKEIQENVGTNKPVTMADQEKLPYCRAVMYEVLRMCFTKVNLSPTHTFSEDLTVNGYTLPKGAWLMAALCTVNLDPNIFPEPEKFKPERFINENGQLFGY